MSFGTDFDRRVSTAPQAPRMARALHFPRLGGTSSITKSLRAFTVAATAALLVSTAPVSAQYGPVDPYDSAMRALRDSIGSSNDAEQHAGMVSLRELRDAQLKPLLQKFLHSDDWSLRVDSVLGLAELDVSGKIDTNLVGSLPAEGDQETAVATAVGLGMLDADRINAMLAWDDLPSPQKLLLACALRKLGGTPDVALVTKLTESRTPEVAVLATALLLDLGSADPAAADRARATLSALPPKTRAAIVAQSAEGSSANNLKGAAPFIASLIELPDVADDARLRALGSLLVLAPEVAYPVLAARLERDRSQTSLMRFAAVLLASGVRAPKTEWDRLRNGDALIEALADAGTAIGESRDQDAYAQLLALKHRVALRAATEGSLRLGDSAERALGLAAAKYLVEERRAAAPLIESLTRAIARLAQVAPTELAALLASVEDDRALQETFILALASAGTREAAEVAAAARGKSSRSGEAMIAVLGARHVDNASEDVLRELATVAGGGTGVSPVIRTQAAWLWLRHAKRTDDAIALLTSADAKTDGAAGGTSTTATPPTTDSTPSSKPSSTSSSTPASNPTSNSGSAAGGSLR
jgi:hypothetical protein